MKKLFSTLLVFFMLFNISAPVFAAESYQDIQVKSTDFDGIYESIDGQYFMKIEQDTATISDSKPNTEYIPVDRIDVNFSDVKSVNSFINRNDIPDEVLNSFREKYQNYLTTENNTGEIPQATLFAPTARAGGNPDQTITYNYNGWSMMTYQYNYTNLSTGWTDVKTGTGTKDTTKLVKDVALSVGSLISKRLSYFTTAKSIFDSFLSYYNLSDNSVSTNVKDYFQARLEWNQSERYTMRDFGGSTGWQTGLVTYMVTINRLGQETYFANSGKPAYTTDTRYSTVVKSPDYDSPWAAAYNNGIYTEWRTISWSTGPIKYDFN